METEKRRLKMAERAKDLYDMVYSEYVKSFPSAKGSRVTNSVLFGYALDYLYKEPDFSRFNWPQIARMTVKGLSEQAPTGTPYITSLTLPTSLYPNVTWDAVEQLKKHMTPLFRGIRRVVYVPFVVRVVLLAFLLCRSGAEIPLIQSPTPMLTRG